MNTKPFIKTIGYIAFAGLVLGLVLALTYKVERIQENVTQKPLRPEAIEVNLTASRHAHEDSMNEIRKTLNDMKEQFSYQLSEIKKLSHENRQSISELRALNEDTMPRVTADFSYDNNTDDSEPDFDYQREQDELSTESRQMAYMQQVDDLYMLQEEDASWSAQVESEFSSAFENYMNQIQLSSVSCGDSMCKVSAHVITTDGTSPDELPPLDHIIHGDAKWEGRSLYMIDMNTGEITLYLMRDGVTLPIQQDWSS